MGRSALTAHFRKIPTIRRDLRLLSILSAMMAQLVKLRKILEDEEHLLTENIILKDELKEKYNIHNMIGNSSAMQLVYENIIQVAHSNATVLVHGESGTGKELVAHAIHHNSLRAAAPFVRMNCAAVPETLIESELFGHVRGALQAQSRKKENSRRRTAARFSWTKSANYPMNLQVRLLRVLQEKEIERVGGIKTIKINVRIIAATNRNLRRDRQKSFSRRPVLSSQCLSNLYSAAARTENRYFAVSGTLSAKIRQRE